MSPLENQSRVGTDTGQQIGQQTRRMRAHLRLGDALLDLMEDLLKTRDSRDVEGAGLAESKEADVLKTSPVDPHAGFREHPLYIAFADAWLQATKGKGQRHGGEATPFYDQAWLSIANAQGTAFLTGQAAKKLQELGERVTKGSGLTGDEAWQRELLGSLVYLGMAYLHGTGMAPGNPRPAWVATAQAEKALAQSNFAGRASGQLSGSSSQGLI